MREYTQTVTGERGNCWQTAVACLLDIDPATLPPQCEYDRKTTHPDGTVEHGPHYYDALQAYLHKHHSVCYLELHHPEELWPLLRVAEPGYHLMVGETVRSASLGGLRHVVVARYGQVIWDPHPSRAGLTGDIRWAFLVPVPKVWEEHWNKRYRECACPACAPKPLAAAHAAP